MMAKLFGSIYVRAATLGLVYWLLVILSVKLVFAVDDIALFWPPNAIAVAALVFSGRRHWPVYLVAVMEWAPRAGHLSGG